MLTIRVRTPINTKPSNVFCVLKDFRNYRQWNPCIIINGNAIEGERVQIKPRQITFWTSRRYQVEIVDIGEKIVWREISWFCFIIHTRREHMMYSTNNGSVIYSTKLHLVGLLSNIAGYFYGKVLYKRLTS